LVVCSVHKTKAHEHFCGQRPAELEISETVSPSSVSKHKYAFPPRVLTVSWSANEPVNDLRAPVKNKNHTLSLWHLKAVIASYPKLQQHAKTGEGYNQSISHSTN